MALSGCSGTVHRVDGSAGPRNFGGVDCAALDRSMDTRELGIPRRRRSPLVVLTPCWHRGRRPMRDGPAFGASFRAGRELWGGRLGAAPSNYCPGWVTGVAARLEGARGALIRRRARRSR